MNRMHNFSFRMVGNLARNPESIVVLPDKCFTRFCLISNDFVVEDAACEPCVTSAWFIAVGDLGEELVFKARKGDQLIVEGVVLKEHWTDQNQKTEANQRVKQRVHLLGDRLYLRSQASTTRSFGSSSAPRPPAE